MGKNFDIWLPLVQNMLKKLAYPAFYQMFDACLHNKCLFDNVQFLFV